MIVLVRPRRNEKWWRFGVASLALLVFSLSGPVPAADAALEGKQVGFGVHVESEETECEVHHDHLFCTLCRAIGLTFSSDWHRVPIGLTSPLRVDDHGGTASLLPSTRPTGTLGPRAPPLA